MISFVLVNYTLVNAMLSLWAGTPDNYIQNLFSELPQYNERKLIKTSKTDSIDYKLFIHNSENLPAFYSAEIFTPVCYSDKCLPVYINLYWDLLGNYIQYDLAENRILTKSDHIPFTKDDYKKLHEILLNSNSLLKEYKAEELVVSTKNDNTNSVDAITGATLKTIKNEVIDGAVYSCYTLWHIAYGKIAEEVKNKTEKLVSEELLHYFLISGNYHYQYYAIEKLIVNNEIVDLQYINGLLSILRGDNVFVSRHLLQQIPSDIFNTQERQLWLWETYLSANYRLQLDILDKMKSLSLIPDIHPLIVNEIEKSNEDQFRKLILLVKNNKKLPKDSLAVLAKELNNRDRSHQIYSLLDGQENLTKSIRKQMNFYKHNNL